MRMSFLLPLLLLVCVLSAGAQSIQPLGIRMEGYDYPHPVKIFKLEVQQQRLEMAYMDMIPARPNGKTVVLFHGKNFYAAYWKDVVSALNDQGYRVVVPDQIGFGKSSKPQYFQYSLHQLAHNTKKLLEHLKISKISLAGHSMGGMLAIRFSLMYPDVVERLVLENPIGLEDYKLKAPYRSIDELYRQELKVKLEKLREYQKTNYYHGEWKEEYDQWVMPIFRMTLSGDYPRLAWNSALSYDMIYTQPVVYELKNLRMPVLLIIGQMDRTALGKDSVSDAVRKTLGNYPELGKQTAKAIPGAILIELQNIGHIPHVEALQQFLEPFLDFLGR